jgi:hypothetical protein
LTCPWLQPRQANRCARAMACISPRRVPVSSPEREVDRWLNSRPVAVALPVEEQKAPAPAATKVVSALVPVEQLPRMLSIEEANQLLKRLEEKHK